MRTRRCTTSILVTFLVLLIITLFLDDPILLVCAISLGLFLSWRYLIFYRNISAVAKSFQISRIVEKPIIRQGKQEGVCTTLSLVVPISLTVQYYELLPDGAEHVNGELKTQPLSSGAQIIRLSYRFIPYFHGTCILPGGRLIMSDLFFEVTLPCTSKIHRGPGLKVHPQPGVQRIQEKNEFGSREVDRVGLIKGYGIRMYREYVQGDDVRNVDWKLSAKRDGLVIREYGGVESFVPLIIVDLPDRDQEYDTTTFEKVVGAISSLIEQSLQEKTETSLLIISGPNVIEMIHEERNQVRFMDIIRDKLHPQSRLHHMYRLAHRSTMREQIRRLEKQTMNEKPSSDTDFSLHLIKIFQKNLLNIGTPQFSRQVGRILNSLRTETVYLYSLCYGDISHIQEIALQARRHNIRFILRTPQIQNEQRRAALVDSMRGEIVEGIS